MMRIHVNMDFGCAVDDQYVAACFRSIESTLRAEFAPFEIEEIDAIIHYQNPLGERRVQTFADLPCEGGHPEMLS